MNPKTPWVLPPIDKMQLIASDIESTGLLHHLKEQGKAARLHNLGLIDIATGKPKLLEGTQKKQIQAIIDKPNVVFLMHNGITYDKPALEMLGIDTTNMQIIDTLAISWYLEPKKKLHGLEMYGEEFGVKKPPVTDWINGDQETYNHRVMEDCKIQQRLWQRQYRELKQIYITDEAVFKFIEFLMFKMHLQITQQNNPFKLNIPKTEALFKVLDKKLEAKVVELIEVMPEVPIKKVKTRPKKCFKKASTPEKPVYSAIGIAWYKLCNSIGKSGTFNGEIIVTTGHKEGNPNSPQQMKDWLFSLGWVPETFDFKRNKDTGEVREIPQINLKNTGGEVCPSIHKLMKKNPELEHIVGLGILKHRLGMVKGFLNNHEDGYITARCNGFTNTLRLKHSNLVNLPSTRVPWGEEIRGLLEIDEGYIELGSDLSSLEDRCKHHFQWKYDPEYVKKQMADDYDPHLEICLSAGMLTQEQIDAHKAHEEDHSDVRHLGKGTNYSCQYGAGGAAVARSAGVALKVGNELRDAYWKLNWSIKTIAENTTVKEIGNKKWQLNPVNGFWYWLKADKDRFSTLCQGLGAYIFDMWSMELFAITQERFGRDPMYVAQFHDEIILKCRDTEAGRQTWDDITMEAISRVNSSLNLNRELGCDVQFGANYSEIH